MDLWGDDAAFCQITLTSCFLIEMAPLFDQSLFEMVDVTDLSTVDALLQHAPYLVVNRVRAVWRPLLGLMKSCVSAFSNGTVSLAR